MKKCLSSYQGRGPDSGDNNKMMTPLQIARMRRLIALRSVAQRKNFAVIPPVDDVVISLAERANSLTRPYANPPIAAHTRAFA